jgi:hypothetical protein
MTKPTPSPHLTSVKLPHFGMPDAIPELPPQLYTSRVAELRRRADDRGLDIIVVYADREHSANLA